MINSVNTLASECKITAVCCLHILATLKRQHKAYPMSYLMHV